MKITDLVIASNNLNELKYISQDQVYQVNRINIKNAVVIKFQGFCHIYVNPNYQNYRYAAKKLFNIPDGYDIDHVFSRKLANQINSKYVLLAMVPADVNRSHGKIERNGVQRGIILGKSMYADQRIIYKMTSISLSEIGTVSELYDFRLKGKHNLNQAQINAWKYAFQYDNNHTRKFCDSLKKI